MMTITPEQLDELERKASAALSAIDYECPAWYPAWDIVDDLDSYADAEHIAANSPDVTLQLVAIARAALAWKSARMVPGIAAEREAAHALIAALEGSP